MGTGGISLPGCLVLLQKLIPVFSLVPSKQWRTLVKKFVHWPPACPDQNPEDTGVCWEKRRKGIAAFQSLSCLQGWSKCQKSCLGMSLTNRHPGNHVVFEVLCLNAEEELREKWAVGRTHPSECQLSCSCPWCISCLSGLLEDRAARYSHFAWADKSCSWALHP